MRLSTGSLFGMTNPTHRAMAALHSAATFVADSELPQPERVEIVRHATDYTVLQQLATAYGVSIETSGLHCWVTIPIAQEATHGIDIVYVAMGNLPATTPMNLPPRGEGITTDPWADVIPPSRCAASWPGPENGRRVKDQGHSGLHFFDDDLTNGAHGA